MRRRVVSTFFCFCACQIKHNARVNYVVKESGPECGGMTENNLTLRTASCSGVSSTASAARLHKVKATYLFHTNIQRLCKQTGHDTARYKPEFRICGGDNQELLHPKMVGSERVEPLEHAGLHVVTQTNSG